MEQVGSVIKSETNKRDQDLKRTIVAEMRMNSCMHHLVQF